MDKAREELIDHLIIYKKAKNHDMTVVFDAYKQGYNYEYSSFRGGIRIIYTRLGESADEVIKRLIREIHREWVVITSDRDIAKYTWSMSSIPVPSNIFWDILDRTLQNVPDIAKDKDEIDYIDDMQDIKPQKGSAYKLSKKHRALRRIMDKL